MSKITEEKLTKLLKKHQKAPQDTDIINQIALGYMQNPNRIKDDEDFKFFQKAYNQKKSVKSTHNFAWFIYFESSGDWELDEGVKNALKIQLEAIKLKPNSYYPYYQYGYMLMEQEEFEEAIKYLNIAKQKTNLRGVVHNLGVCYFRLGKYTIAKEYFAKSAKMQDIEHRSLFNLAVTEYKLNNLDRVAKLIEKLQNLKEEDDPLCTYEIGELWFLLGEYEKSAKWTIKQGLDGIDLLDWKALAYSMYITNKEIFNQELKKSLQEKQLYAKEISSNHPNWAGLSQDDKEEELQELKNSINFMKHLDEKFKNKPTINYENLVVIEPLGCLLFDCGVHGNIKDDRTI